MRGGAKPTETIQAACVEICESRFDRVLFSVIDTPGLDFQEGRELVLERQLGRVVRYLDQQYADTMSEVRGFIFIFILFAISAYNSECIVVLCEEGTVHRVPALACVHRNPKSCVRARETNMFICTLPFLPLPSPVFLNSNYPDAYT